MDAFGDSNFECHVGGRINSGRGEEDARPQLCEVTNEQVSSNVMPLYSAFTTLEVTMVSVHPLTSKASNLLDSQTQFPTIIIMQ